MERNFRFSSEQDFVRKTLSEVYSLLQDGQPSHMYPGNWYEGVQLRNTVNRIIRDYEEACRQGYRWAEYLAPATLFPNWAQYVQFSKDIDARRFTFIQCCDAVIGNFESLANRLEVTDPSFSSELRAKIKNIEQIKNQYVEPLTRQRPIIRQYK